jgi:hypothetical protein
MELAGKVYVFRADMLALREASKAGIEISDLSPDKDGQTKAGPAEVAELCYYFAKAGARHEGRKFETSLDDWLSTLQVSDMARLADALTGVLSDGKGEKKAKAKKAKK